MATNQIRKPADVIAETLTEMDRQLGVDRTSPAYKLGQCIGALEIVLRELADLPHAPARDRAMRIALDVLESVQRKEPTS